MIFPIVLFPLPIKPIKDIFFKNILSSRKKFQIQIFFI